MPIPATQPALLEHAVGALQAERADLLTVATHQVCLGFWERVVMPQIWLLLGLRYQPERVNRATRPRDVIANGQFIMMPREAYEAIGTHEAVRHEVAEDLALAQRCVASGRKLWFAYANTLIETRMYRSLGHLVEGWSKNVYLGRAAELPRRAGAPRAGAAHARLADVVLAAAAGGAGVGRGRAAPPLARAGRRRAGRDGAVCRCSGC